MQKNRPSLAPRASDPRSNDVVEPRKVPAKVGATLQPNGILAGTSRRRPYTARARVLPVERVHDGESFDDATDRRKAVAVERVEIGVVHEIEVQLRGSRVRSAARERHRAAFVGDAHRVVGNVVTLPSARDTRVTTDSELRHEIANRSVERDVREKA